MTVRNLEPYQQIQFIGGYPTKRKSVSEADESHLKSYNYRTLFHDEFIADCESKEEAKKTEELMKRDGLSFQAWKTGGRGFHLQTYFPEFLKLEQEQRDEARKLLTSRYKLNVNDTRTETRVVGRENMKHRNMKGIKTLIGEVKGTTDKLPEGILEEAKSIKKIEIVTSIEPSKDHCLILEKLRVGEIKLKEEGMEKNNRWEKLLALDGYEKEEIYDLVYHKWRHNIAEFEGWKEKVQGWKENVEGGEIDKWNCGEVINGCKIAGIPKNAQMELCKKCKLRKSGLDKYFDYFDGIKFVAKLLADELMTEYVVKTMEDTEEVYIYKDGVYVEGEKRIKEEVEKRLKDETTKHRVDEVLGHLQRSSYVEREKFDSDLNIINLKNGLFDIRIMELKEHTSKFLSLNQLSLKYNKEAKCPKIMKFLKEILFEADIPLIQEAFGFLLFRKYSIHKAFMFIGSGGEGKSTLLGLMGNFIGRKNYCSITLQDINKDQFCIVHLFGKMANLAGDIPKTALESSSMFKWLTGKDPITANKKFKQRFTFVNYAKCFFSANEIPASADDTDAFHDRWIMITFPNKYRGTDKEDTKLDEKLAQPEELSGLFNFAIEGLRRLLENGKFSYIPSTEDNRIQWTKLSDPVKAFYNEMVIADPNASILKSDLYDRYGEFCDKNKLPQLANNSFGRRFKDVAGFGICDVKIGTKYGLLGVRMKTKEDKGKEEVKLSDFL